jgi:signal transduction histidine kinase
VAGLSLLLPAAATSAPSESIPTPNPILFTNLQDVWSAPLPERDTAHRVRFEMVIYYFDANWAVCWGECNGQPNWLPIVGCPTPLKSGQRVEFDGYMVPNQERLDWSQTRVHILESDIPLRPESVEHLLENARERRARWVSVEGLIDQLQADSTHITLRLLSGAESARVIVLRSATNSPTLHEGDFIRLNGVYSPQFNENGNLRELEIWTPDLSQVEAHGSLMTDPRFGTPVIETEKFVTARTNQLIHVEGVVRAQEPGKWVTLWDATGQITVQSSQRQLLRPGERIEAIGYPQVLGVHHYLRGAVYRVTKPSPAGLRADVAAASPVGVLRLAEQVRDLTREEAAQHPKVLLRGAITWSHADTPFAYLQDDSGGIRLVGAQFDKPDTTILGTIVEVRGEAAPGGFVPVVTNAVVVRTGWWPMPERGSELTLDQAMTGTEDGNWVEMQGFVRNVTQENGLLKMEVSTGTGTFEAWMPIVQSSDSLHRATVRVSGICASKSNERGQLVGVQIWVPEPKDLQLINPAPADLFAVPFRSLDSLRRFDVRNAVDQWVRTKGSVVFQVPGQFVSMQDRTFSIYAVSQETNRFRPGDLLEAVGLPTHQDGRFTLRETVFRRVGSGSEPPPERLVSSHDINLGLDGRLAYIEGILLNNAQRDGEARLLIRNGTATFEASLDLSMGRDTSALAGLDLGSRLGLTGVYEVQSDEHGTPRGFQLRLRSWSDVQVLQKAPWWNLTRLLWLLAAVLAASLVAFAWVMLISHKNTLLRHAESELQSANDQLEHRVAERTRELQEQVAAKERAHAALAEAQRQLMKTSRLAGMAEVATGVLHNVGNVLNSANVSVTTVRDRLNRFRQDRLTKVVRLLQEHQADLGQFLMTDPKGQKLIPYLKTLDAHMDAEQQDINTELMSLIGNIEHIKEIVSMQQSNARKGGVIEILNAAEVVEDVIRMQSDTYARHGLELNREFEPAPPFPADRHSVIQILTNLLQNAIYACEQNGNGNRKVTVRIRQPRPDAVQIVVADNGMGISPENLAQMFSFGFTTRRNGHGFGLHSGALAAKELGGSLTVASDGPGRGAVFTLELPLTHPTDGPKAN